MVFLKWNFKIYFLTKPYFAWHKGKVEMSDGLGLYIHIPFCVKKCVYCDFLSAPATRRTQQRYVEALKREISREAVNYKGRGIQTVFIGGGTPSVLAAQELAGILDCIREYYVLHQGAEITMELNPGTATRKKLLQWRKAGVNRLSIGLQSADNEELRLLGRIHTFEEFLQTYHLAREAGFDNLNVDLMSALPGQTMESWYRTLQKVLALQPEHISAYSLIIEEGTPLYEKLETYPDVPDEETDRRMYSETKRILAENGYWRYEISNYARDGYACRHNRIYWQRGAEHMTDYAGFGIGAASTVHNMRWKNTQDLEKYLQAFSAAEDGRLQETDGSGIKEDFQELSLNECMEEFMYLGLRMMCGVSKAEFFKSFGRSMDAVYYDVIQKWTQLGMLVQEGDFVRLTDAGIDISNVVLAEFLL